jgi:hypothetical protein
MNRVRLVEKGMGGIGNFDYQTVHALGGHKTAFVSCATDTQYWRELLFGTSDPISLSRLTIVALHPDDGTHQRVRQIEATLLHTLSLALSSSISVVSQSYLVVTLCYLQLIHASFQRLARQSFSNRDAWRVKSRL